MKTNFTMTPIQIASNVIEKLQEENRISLDTLHKTQNDLKYFEHQLHEKEQLIKILEDRLRAGSNSFLEMGNRQKKITIKHLELQIQKLLKENKDLEDQINSVKFDICARCEMKLLIDSEESRPKQPLKSSALRNAPGKKITSHGSQSREKTLERIIEHKDKRIQHLSKEVQRLLHSEKELTNKVYRLTKLLPMSRLPSETLIECLLKEIQLLESQLQQYGLSKVSSSNQNLILKGTNIYPPSNNYSPMKLKESTSIQKEVRDTDLINAQQENVTLVSNLNQLFHDVSELKQLFASENEKLFQNLTKHSLKNDALKIQWKEIINRVNDIVESLQNILKIDSIPNNNSSSNLDVKEDMLQRLRDRLRDAFAEISKYEEENANLKQNLEDLSAKFRELQENLKSSEKIMKSMSEERAAKSQKDLGSSCNEKEVQHLTELLNAKDKQLECAENHIKTYQSVIEQLQMKSSEIQDHIPSAHSNKFNSSESKHCTDNAFQYNIFERKLEVAERSIKTCEHVIEGLQKMVSNLEEENSKLQSDQSVLKTKLQESEDKLISAEKINKELLHKIDSLEEDNSTLLSDLQQIKDANTSLQDISQEKTRLMSKLSVSEQKLRVLEDKLTESQISVEKLKDENEKLHSDLRVSESKDNMTGTYEDDVMYLRNELILKEGEIQNLKESLHAFERKAYEMNHYRKALRQEIEKLCDVLLENTESGKTSANRKAIYNAAVLRSAQSLLRFDDDYNLDHPETPDALEEMKHQVSVYLTEVARIHELLTIKEKQRDEFIKQYLDLNNQIGSSSHDLFVKGESRISGVESFPVEINPQSSSESIVNSSSESGIHSVEKSVQTDRYAIKHNSLNRSPSETGLKALQKELEDSKSVTSFFVSKCSQLEDVLIKERTELAQCQRESEIHTDTIKDLRSQLSVKNNTAKRMNTLIEVMRSKECSDDIAMEQMKSEMKWLVDENQKVFENITTTQSELSKCKEENFRIQNDLNNLKRQLINEKYEHAKVNNELKHLRTQLDNSQSSNINDT